MKSKVSPNSNSMISIEVPLGSRSYPILVGSGMLASVAERILQVVPATRVVVLTHPHLAGRYAGQVIAGFARLGVHPELVTVPPGERYKSLLTVARLYDRLLDAGLDRKGLLITVGGGVLGDVGGFVAATYLRGIAFAQVPTTLLAQVDASVGGKTGVDLARGKNLVGAFHQPRAVVIDTDTLSTLSARELRSGLAEVVKYGIIRDESFFANVVDLMPLLLRRDPAALSYVIVRSCRIKAEVVSEDETEQGVRAILNFGHTIGHALEAVTEYRRFKHGEAVSIGMVAAALVGEEAGETAQLTTQKIIDALRAARLPVGFPVDVDVAALMDAMMRDKKTIGGRLRFVLASGIGRAMPDHVVKPDLVRRALAQQREPA